MVTILDMATIHSLLGLVGGTVPFMGFVQEGVIVASAVWDVCFRSGVGLRESPPALLAHTCRTGGCDSTDVIILRLFFF